MRSSSTKSSVALVRKSRTRGFASASTRKKAPRERGSEALAPVTGRSSTGHPRGDATPCPGTRSPGGRGRCLCQPDRLQPALGVDRRPAPIAGGGDRLAIAMVVDIAGDEDAFDLRLGLV